MKKYHLFLEKEKKITELNLLFGDILILALKQRLLQKKNCFWKNNKFLKNKLLF